jgi:hypothetical protein
MQIELSNLWLLALVIAKLSITTGFGFGLVILAGLHVVQSRRKEETSHEVARCRVYRAHDITHGRAASVRRRIRSYAAVP